MERTKGKRQFRHGEHILSTSQYRYRYVRQTAKSSDVYQHVTKHENNAACCDSGDHCRFCIDRLAFSSAAQGSAGRRAAYGFLCRTGDGSCFGDHAKTSSHRLSRACPSTRIYHCPARSDRPLARSAEDDGSRYDRGEEPTSKRRQCTTSWQESMVPSPPKPLALAGHYDTVPTTPGAGDDTSALATMLETARALVAAPILRNDVILIFTDEEEYGQSGAKAFTE